MATVESNDSRGPVKLNGRMFAGLGLVSAVYFADMFVKAGRKLFWFDELYTYYLCRLPSFKDTWMAVMHGADFNPPLFYLQIRGAQRIFGDGLVATRLPAILGVWLFGVCLFLFVARRAGGIAGFIAGVFPFFTLIKYYAYEARPHGIVLGWCGLMLLCWERNAEGRARYLWLGGFGLSFLCALLSHIFAVYLLVPFAMVEIYNLVKEGRPNWGIVAVMALVLTAVAVTVYLPLFRSYRTNMSASFGGVGFGSLERFLIDVIGPAAIILFLFILITAAQAMRRNQEPCATAAMPRREMVLAAGFACMPVAGAIGCEVSRGPFFSRYFLASVAGYSIFAAFAISSRYCNAWVGRAMAGFMLLLMLADMGATLYVNASNGWVLHEPGTNLLLSTTPSNPMQNFHTLAVDHDGLDILFPPSFDYLYLEKYAPASVVSHLYYGGGVLGNLATWARIDLHITSFNSFLTTHRRFLFYESRSGAGEGPKDGAVEAIAGGGYRLKSVSVDVEGFLYEFEK